MKRKSSKMRASEKGLNNDGAAKKTAFSDSSSDQKYQS